MRRRGGFWPTVTSFDNLQRAALRAARGKRRKLGIARFLADLEPEILALQRALRAGTWRPGRPTTFEIHDPKRRTITAAPFPDRVVHHALIDVLEPVLDARMIEDSFACRRGKGTHAALDRGQRLLGRFGWFLKLDVAGFFGSLDHGVVLETLQRVLKDRAVLELCETIVRAGGPHGTGLPIGNLTSQWFANLTLDRLDHHVKERLGVRGYLRYMDDFVLFADTKPELSSARAALEAFLATPLHLRLKERATILAPASEGLPFLGWRVYRGMRRLRPQNLRRVKARLRRRGWQLRTGEIDEECFVAALRASVEHLRHGSTRALRRALFAEAGESPGSVFAKGPGPRRREPRDLRRVVQERREERALREPQRLAPEEPQRQRRVSSRQDVGRASAPSPNVRAAPR